MFASPTSFAHLVAGSNSPLSRQIPSHERGQSMDRKPAQVVGHQYGHQRSLTEDHKRPPFIQMRSRSNTSTSSSDIPFARKALSPDFALDGSPRGSFDNVRRRPPKPERPDSIRRTLVSKSSRLFKSRPSSGDDLTSLQPLDWSEEFENDICPVVDLAATSRPVSRHFRKLSDSKGKELSIGLE